MQIAITILITLVIVVAISAFFLIRPRKKLNYSRMIDKDFRDNDTEEISRPLERTRAPRMKSFNGDTSLTPLIIGIVRAVIGLAAVGVLAYIYTSTQNSLEFASAAVLTPAQVAQATQIYTEGIFKAVLTIGIAAALYIFTKFHR
jgi:hypothetical protein